MLLQPAFGDGHMCEGLGIWTPPPLPITHLDFFFFLEGVVDCFHFLIPPLGMNDVAFIHPPPPPPTVSWDICHTSQEASRQPQPVARSARGGGQL